MDARISLGISMCRVGAYDKAVILFRETAEMDPEIYAVWMNLGLALMHDGKLKKAIQAYKKAYDLNPQKTGAMEELVNLYFRTGQVKKAEDWCMRLLEAAPDAVEARVALALSLVARGQWKEAQAETAKAKTLDLNAENVFYLDGRILEHLGELEAAAEMYKIELGRYWRNPDAFKSLARVYQALGRGAEAVETLETAVGAYPHDFDCHLKLAQAYVREKIFHDKALETAKKAVELDNKSQEAWDAFNALHALQKNR